MPPRGVFGALLAGLGASGVSGHGAMYEPPTRNSAGVFLLGPSCAGGACQWYSQGTSIGCAEASGRYGAEADCDNPAEPRLNWDTHGPETEKNLLQYKHDGYGNDNKFFPWRYPGSAPVADSCGVAAGGAPPLGQLDPPPASPAGAKGSELPKLLEKTVWVAGSVVEVAWAIGANHGGGYQYRLCPADQALNEECFQKRPLEFVGDKSWIQWGQGLDVSTRIEVDARDASGDQVVPEGSTWRKNPIPGCKDNGGRAKKPCLGPTFPAPLDDRQFKYGNDHDKGLFGYGSGRCMGNLTTTPTAECTLEEYRDVSFDFGIVDKVRVPEDLPPGEYVLSWRWDCEMTKQIWNSCSDITVKDKGLGSAPFTPMTGCSACCVEGGICAHCRKCVNDKTGECFEKCWQPFPWWGEMTHWMQRSANIQCLGEEEPWGGPRTWLPGDKFDPPWSPGCTRCWANDEAMCKKAKVRPVKVPEGATLAGESDYIEFTAAELVVLCCVIFAFAGITCFGVGRYAVKRSYAKFTDEQDPRTSVQHRASRSVGIAGDVQMAERRSESA